MGWAGPVTNTYIRGTDVNGLKSANLSALTLKIISTGPVCVIFVRKDGRKIFHFCACSKSKTTRGRLSRLLQMYREKDRSGFVLGKRSAGEVSLEEMRVDLFLNESNLFWISTPPGKPHITPDWASALHRMRTWTFTYGKWHEHAVYTFLG